LWHNGDQVPIGFVCPGLDIVGNQLQKRLEQFQLKIIQVLEDLPGGDNMND